MLEPDAQLELRPSTRIREILCKLAKCRMIQHDTALTLIRNEWQISQCRKHLFRLTTAVTPV